MRTDDGRIVQQCLNGEPGAFGVLVDQYKEGIYAFAYDKLRDFHDAQDVTQEVFLQAYRGLGSLRRWESFGFWLYRIAYARCAEWLRVRSKRVDQDFIEEQNPKVIDARSLDLYREDQLSESVGEALDSLPMTYREVLTLYYFGGMNSVDIAKVLGTSPTAIRHRLSRARARLREEMIAMMDTAFEGHRLPMGFTFRIVEAVKRIKIDPMPRMTGLPWGLSLAAGIAVLVMTLGSQMTIHQQPTLLMFPSETETLKVREMSVDILSAPGTSGMAGKQGDTDGGGIDPRNPQNTFLLAPAKGGGAWTQKADMPTARSNSGAAVVDGKIYVVGGYINTAPWLTTAAMEEYNPATDTWTTIGTDMPTNRAGVSSSAVNGIIYAIGGWSPNSGHSSAAEAYDPVADKWTKKTSMPTKRVAFATAVVDGKIYIIGGHVYTGTHNVLSTVEVYDPATDKWTKRADMPMARFSLAACVIDGRIYVSGGHPTWEGGMTIPTVEVYDPATDTWARSSDMPWPRGGHTASAVDGRMYLIGGLNTETIDLVNAGKIGVDELEEQFSSVDVYDPATDTWTTAASIPTPRSSHDAAVVNGKIYVMGGEWGPESTLLSTVEEYDPSLSGNIAITSPAGKLLRTWGEVKSQ